jgi:threonine/homoserine/homoserine lactone efflux protein
MILLLPFLVLAILVIVTPGPDMTLVTRNALKAGRRSALLTSLGTVTGLLVWTAAAAIGIAAILEANAVAFTVVRLAGASYLGYLGIRALISAWRDGARNAEIPVDRSAIVRVNSPYGQGLLTNILNPKIAVLFTSLIPQFIIPGTSSVAFDSLELAGIFTAMGLGWLIVFSIFVSTAGSVIRRPRIKKILDTITGAALIGLGIRVMAETVVSRLSNFP